MTMATEAAPEPLPLVVVAGDRRIMVPVARTAPVSVLRGEIARRLRSIGSPLATVPSLRHEGALLFDADIVGHLLDRKDVVVVDERSASPALVRSLAAFGETPPSSGRVRIETASTPPRSRRRASADPAPGGAQMVPTLSGVVRDRSAPPSARVPSRDLTPRLRIHGSRSQELSVVVADDAHSECSVGTRLHAAMHEMSLDILLRFVPNLVVEQARSAPPTAPTTVATHGSILFVDITGFTRLTEELAAQGAQGREAISRVINECFTFLIVRCAEHGGQVLKTAGDALFVFFDAGTAERAACVATAQRAVACASHIQAAVAEASEGVIEQLELKTMVGSGTVDIVYAGGYQGKLEFFPAGPTMDVVCESSAHLVPRLVFVCATTAELLADYVKTDAEGVGQRPLQLLAHDETGVELVPLAVQRLASHEALQPFVSDQVLRRLAEVAATPDDEVSDAIAELRVVSVLFLRVTRAGDLPLVELAQRIMVIAQRVLSSQRLNGMLRQFMLDDKGLVLIAAFGALTTHADDAVRACLAALELQLRLDEVDVATAIGISTGRAFCGLVGSERRCEYALVGGAVNMAARLMTSTDRILCCESTMVAAGLSGSVRFEAMSPVKVKGREDAVPVFRPVQVTRKELVLAGPFAGRAAELAKIDAQITQLTETDRQPLVLVSGGRGVGKSTLVHTALARFPDLHIYVGRGSYMDRNTPLHAFASVVRPILRRLTRVGDETARASNGLSSRGQSQSQSQSQDSGGSVSREELMSAVKSWVQHAMPDFVEMLPLVNYVLPTKFRSAKNLMQRSLLQHAPVFFHRVLDAASVSFGPLLVFFDDAHLLDSTSWKVLQSIANSDGIGVIVALQPADNLPSFKGRTVQIDLSDIESAAAARPFAAAFLSAKAVDDAVVDFLFERSGGNIMLMAQAARLLDEGKYLTWSDNKLSFGTSPSTLGDNIGTADSLVLSSVDAVLKPPQLQALKMLSVLGSDFSGSLAAHVVPASAGFLSEFCAAKLLICEDEGDDDEVRYRFRQTVVCDALYNVSLPSALVELHRLAAEYFDALPERTATNLAQAAGHYRACGRIRLCIERSMAAATIEAEQGLSADALRVSRSAYEALNEFKTKGGEIGAAKTLAKEVGGGYVDASFTSAELVNVEARLLLAIGRAALQTMDWEATAEAIEGVYRVTHLRPPSSPEGSAAAQRECAALWRKMRFRRLFSPRSFWTGQYLTGRAGAETSEAVVLHRIALEATLVLLVNGQRLGLANDERASLWAILTALEYGTPLLLAQSFAYGMVNATLLARPGWIRFLQGKAQAILTRAALEAGTASDRLAVAMALWKVSFALHRYGQWDKVEANILRTRSVFVALGAGVTICESSARLEETLYYSGRYAQQLETLQLTLDVSDSAKYSREPWTGFARFWTLHSLTATHAVMGDRRSTHGAIRAIRDQCESLFAALGRDSKQIQTWELKMTGVIAFAHVLLGEYEEASDALVPLIPRIVESTGSCCDEKLTLAALSLAENLQSDAERVTFAELADTAMAAYAEATKASLIDLPKYLFRLGLLERLRFRRAASRKAFVASARAARKLGMPLEAALALFETWRSDLAGSGKRARPADARMALAELTRIRAIGFRSRLENWLAENDINIAGDTSDHSSGSCWKPRRVAPDVYEVE